MLDDKYEPQALMAVCLYTDVDDGEYSFVTNKVDHFPAKSPKGMFDEDRIPNDMSFVISKLNEYYND